MSFYLFFSYLYIEYDFFPYLSTNGSILQKSKESHTSVEMSIYNVSSMIYKENQINSIFQTTVYISTIIIYPLVNKHNYGKIHFSMSISTINIANLRYPAKKKSLCW